MRLSFGVRPVLAPDSVASAPEDTTWLPGSYISACACTDGIESVRWQPLTPHQNPLPGERTAAFGALQDGSEGQQTLDPRPKCMLPWQNQR